MELNQQFLRAMDKAAAFDIGIAEGMIKVAAGEQSRLRRAVLPAALISTIAGTGASQVASAPSRAAHKAAIRASEEVARKGMDKKNVSDVKKYIKKRLAHEDAAWAHAITKYPRPGLFEGTPSAHKSLMRHIRAQREQAVRDYARRVPPPKVPRPNTMRMYR